MARFQSRGTIGDFQTFVGEVYGPPDDRLFSIHDILSNQERFTMRALKGVRKKNRDKVKLNLAISLAWMMAFLNRMHIKSEDILWHRFPFLCSYCGKKPCICLKEKVEKRQSLRRQSKLRPRTFDNFQKMFAEIYPSAFRTSTAAAVHLAEEMGELSEAVHSYLGEHKHLQFRQIETEAADFMSCIFGLANSERINLAKVLSQMFKKNCHTCRNVPCTCNFSSVSKFRS